MKIIASLDGTETSQVVFREALRLARSEYDELILISVSDSPTPVSQDAHQEHIQKQPHEQQKTIQPSLTVAPNQAKAYDPSGIKVKILTEFADQCQKKNIRHRVILGVSQNVGQLLCQAVLDKDADYLILGRSRNSDSSDRHVTSRFCMENALCNVLVVKDLRPIVLHDATIEQIVEVTEQERKRRIQDEGVEEEFSDLIAIREDEECERRRRVSEMYGEEGLQKLEKKDERPKTLAQIKGELETKKQEKFHEIKEKQKAWEFVDKAEEEERSRRMKEEEELDKREKIERELTGRAAIFAEEQEKQRRIGEIEEEKRIEEIKRMAQWEIVKKLEEEERERRMTEAPKMIDREMQIELLGVTHQSCGGKKSND